MYRSLVNYQDEEERILHACQLKDERAQRVVTRNIHPTTKTEQSKSEMDKMGHKERGIMNRRQGLDKTTLLLFFVDREETVDNNKEIYNSRYVLQTQVTVKTPRRKECCDTMYCMPIKWAE